MGWFSSHPQLIETTEGSFSESLMTLLTQSTSPFSAQAVK